MKILVVILMNIITAVAYCAYRPIDITKEIQNANFVGEIKFIGYDSILVSVYSDYYHPVRTDSLSGKSVRVENQDSVWIMSKIYYQVLNSTSDSILSADIYSNHSWGRYRAKPDHFENIRVSNGFWPKLNENCLMIIDSTLRVSVFASIDLDSYIFWDPYFNTGWNSVFLFDNFFEFYPKNGKNSANSSILESCAKFRGLKYASQYHCRIEKWILWNHIVDQSP